MATDESLRCDGKGYFECFYSYEFCICNLYGTLYFGCRACRYDTDATTRCCPCSIYEWLERHQMEECAVHPERVMVCDHCPAT